MVSCGQIDLVAVFIDENRGESVHGRVVGDAPGVEHGFRESAGTDGGDDLKILPAGRSGREGISEKRGGIRLPAERWILTYGGGDGRGVATNRQRSTTGILRESISENLCWGTAIGRGTGGNCIFRES